MPLLVIKDNFKQQWKLTLRSIRYPQRWTAINQLNGDEVTEVIVVSTHKSQQSVPTVSDEIDRE